MTAIIFGGVGAAVALSPAAQGAAPAAPAGVAELVALLECDERSLTEDGEVQYVVADPPDYVAGYESTRSPESVAAEFAGQQRLAAAVSPQAALSRSSERVAFPLAVPDGRIVGITIAVDDGGWRQGGGIVCAGG